MTDDKRRNLTNHPPRANAHPWKRGAGYRMAKSARIAQHLGRKPKAPK